MNPRRVLNATFWATVFIQSLGAIDVGPKAKEPKRKMPPPKAFAAIFVVWAVLGWIAQVSDNLARAAATLSGLVLLTSLFVNTVNPTKESVAGTRLIHFFDTVSQQFGPQPADQGTTFPAPGPTPEGSLT